MTDGRAHLEGELAELRVRLGDVERRLSHLEGEHGAAEGLIAPGVSLDVPPEGDVAADGGGSTRLVTLTGRTFVIFGVGHLLRGMTDSGLVSPPIGIGIGLAYALAWLPAAFRAIRRGRVRSAAAYGMSASGIAFPLLWEAVTRFHVASAAVGALAILSVGLVFLTLAARWNLRAFALVAAAGAVLSSAALSLGGRAVGLCALSVLLVSGASLWIGWRRGWVFLRWITAAAANLATVGFLAAAGMKKGDLSPGGGVALGLALPLLYVGSAILRLRVAMTRTGSLSPFEMLQNAAALLLGYGGAVAVARSTGQGTGIVVAVSLVLIGATYGSSFGRLAGGNLDRRAFSHFNSLALAFVITASWLALPLPGAAVLWGALAVLGPFLSNRLGRVTFGVHGAAAIAAAAFASGLLSLSVAIFTGSPTHVAEASIPVSAGIVLAAAVLGLLAFGGPARSGGRHRGSAARVVFWGVLVVGVSALVVRGLCPLVASGDAGVGNAASLRTVVLAASVTILGLASLRPRFRDARWLVYPLLVLVALKLIAEDFPHGRPTNLFVSLGCFGLSLIAAARLMGKARRTHDAL